MREPRAWNAVAGAAGGRRKFPGLPGRTAAMATGTHAPGTGAERRHGRSGLLPLPGLRSLMLLAALAFGGPAMAITISDTWTAEQPRVQLEASDFATGTVPAGAEELLEAAHATTLATTATRLPGGSSSGARIDGDCHGSGFATDSTMQAFAEANLAMLVLLQEQLRTGQYDQGALVQAIRTEALARDRKLSAMTEDLAEALATAAGQLGREIDGRDHDMNDTDFDCTDLLRLSAAQAGGTAMDNADAAMGLALATFADGTGTDYADVLHRKERDLVASSLMQDADVMDPDWLLPAGGAIDGADNHVRARKLIESLSNPHPAPGVPQAVASTAAGMAAAMAVREKTALVEVARGALRQVYALHTPLPVYVTAVEAMEEKGGLDDSLKLAAAKDAEGESGYSELQFLEANRRFLGGYSREESLRAANEAGVARLLADVFRLRYHLATLRQRNRLWQTALLAALVGTRTVDLGSEVGRYLESDRP